ncbi:hypothetical protein B0H11DRAFT_2193138 [Mycena galericulata]|nr:hypothetical protein B0H11DRAFT_2193138 [Mycena galericulata]
MFRGVLHHIFELLHLQCARKLRVACGACSVPHHTTLNYGVETLRLSRQRHIPNLTGLWKCIWSSSLYNISTDARTGVSQYLLQRPLISSLPQMYEKFLTPPTSARQRACFGCEHDCAGVLVIGIINRKAGHGCAGLRVAKRVVLRVPGPPRGHGHSGCEPDCAGRYCRGEGACGATQRPAFP